ncbi:hypothetical protein ETAA8_50570 [Anatilimnocola aggregata]|uniref:Suppressor of fused-like domain-containing protein n=1 Tax=Anatilimnocola aggregata TaxID=2528021 RepID=A0A517YI94_9BACT|nr:hypothetical protein [Anatilimnocola aggregata]QDU29939.1 hypothetical protein ETAA8_50570 [Anatilimnocola aggregata]
MSEELLLRTFDCRRSYLQQWGNIDRDLLAPLMNPSLMGGPRWPALRQSWQVVRNGARTVIISDGLSDAFDDEIEPSTGFGIEILAETADPLPHQLPRSWLFELVYAVSQQAAAHGGFRELIDELGLLSLEIQAPSQLRSVASPAGNVGILLGLTAPGRETTWHLPAGRAKVVTAKLLMPAELEYVAENFEEGRGKLQSLFTASGSYHLSSPQRASAI